MPAPLHTRAPPGVPPRPPRPPPQRPAADEAAPAGNTRRAARARAANTRNLDSGEFRAGVTPAGLNPAIPPELQKATFERVFSLGRMLVEQGKVPVIVIDHRLTAMD